MFSSLLSVISPAAARDLTTLDRVKREVGISDKSSDVALSGLIADASRTIASYCNRTFGRETLTETFRWAGGSGQDDLVLARLPISAVTSIVEDGAAPLGIADWEGDLEAAILYRLSNDMRTCWYANKIAVTYIAGYLLPGQSDRDLPEDIERACIMLTKLVYFSQGRDPMVKEETVEGVGSASYYVRGAMDMSIMPVEITSLIDPYRNIQMG